MGDADQAVLPSGGDDTDLAARIAAGDQEAFAALYDRYSDRIYSYCVSVCRNPEHAADAMQDTFLLAFARIGQLRDQSKLRPWLYAIARNECLRQIRATKRTVDLELAGEVADMNATSDTALNAADARALIDDAFEGMNSTDREVLDLALRQDLDNSSIAAVLGVSDNNAAAKVSRAKSQLEKSVGALLLFRSRASGCERLDREIGTDTAYTPLARKRISRHAEDCAQCSKSRSKSVAAIALVGLPVLMAPSWLRDSLLNSVVPQTGAGTTASHGGPTPDVAHGSESAIQPASPIADGDDSSETSHVEPDASQDAVSTEPGGHNDGSELHAPQDQVAASTTSSDGPIFVAMSNSEVPPLPLKDKAAQLAKVRPPFDKHGWPLAGQHKPKRWPLIAGIAAVLVLMGVATGLALTSGEPEPVVAESTNSTAPI
ncbi:MAG: sigma-70 family RNA polymerase sigma factor, partial [Candidatus Nanopelagicales bacterium]